MISVSVCLPSILPEPEFETDYFDVAWRANPSRSPGQKLEVLPSLSLVAGEAKARIVLCVKLVTA